MTIERVGSVAEFAIGRAARLYPSYWLSVAVAGIFLLFTRQTTLPDVLVNATMLQSFAHWPNIIDPYWTLAYELLFYSVIAAPFAAGAVPIALGVAVLSRAYIERPAQSWAKKISIH